MQSKAESDRDYSVEELNDLIKLIKELDSTATADSIASELEYNPGYVSQVKSRKVIPKKFYKAVKGYYERLRNAKGASKSAELPKDQNLVDLIISNRMLVEANKALIDAHHIVCKNNDDLMQIAKSVFNWHTPLSIDQAKQGAFSGTGQTLQHNRFSFQ